ncbi:unnamed protein product [Musa acuminata subsp. malaccensis]|uniref:(wild Malaysian banana) hypothetical protein n=1 Tax=Musa acuminata subsp. malaccensis TaxID=214687 RepID=A0A804KEB3_MUSAM|nr:unnamed protein product [Musa acuminata subsp. malaccensis]
MRMGRFLLVHVHDDKPGRSSALSNLLKQQRKKHNVFLFWFRNTKGYTRLETRKCSQQQHGNHILLSQPRAKRGLSWEARKCSQKVGAVRERIDPWDSRWFKRRQHRRCVHVTIGKPVGEVLPGGARLFQRREAFFLQLQRPLGLFDYGIGAWCMPPCRCLSPITNNTRSDSDEYHHTLYVTSHVKHNITKVENR